MTLSGSKASGAGHYLACAQNNQETSASRDPSAARPAINVRAKSVPKGETRFAGFDVGILSMYARGMSTREIKGHLQELYGLDVSPR